MCQNAFQRTGQQERLDAHVQQSRDRAGRVVGVQRREDEVPGERRLGGDAGRLVVAHLALAGLGAYWLLRCLGVGRSPAALGGIAYAASKFAMTALGTTVGLEERPNGIHVTNVYPGEVDTPILEDRPTPVPPEKRAQMLKPEDIAAAIGTIPETFSRLLLRLKEEKKIRWEGEKLRLAEGFWKRFDP